MGPAMRSELRLHVQHIKVELGGVEFEHGRVCALIEGSWESTHPWPKIHVNVHHGREFAAIKSQFFHDEKTSDSSRPGSFDGKQVIAMITALPGGWIWYLSSRLRALLPPWIRWPLKQCNLLAEDQTQKLRRLVSQRRSFSSAGIAFNKTKVHVEHGLAEA